MSVAASSSETESEAILRAQRAHEPSMEEILASIRAIIADDKEPAKEPLAKEPTAKPQIVYSSESRASEPAPAAVGRKAEAPPAEPPAPEPEEEPLLSEETEGAVSASFQALADQMAAHGREAADKMAREMLRPMLKDWLDANLPAMVERLVKAEIQRLARGGR